MSDYILKNLADIEIPEDGILSRTIHADDRARVVLFAFGEGQELTEHTASVPAQILFLKGDMRLTLGADESEAHPGTWVHMPAHLPHSLLARTPAVMVLTLLRGGAQSSK